jgi:hypothetical protein
MDDLINLAMESGADYVLTIDYDSIFGESHVRHLLGRAAADPDIAAIAPLQVKRGEDYVLGLGVENARPDNRGLLECVSAHFGLTVISLSALRRTPRPWFHSQPAFNGTWRGEGKIDDDEWFWRAFRNAGNKIYLDTHCNIGHLEERVAVYQKDGSVEYMRTDDYWSLIKAQDDSVRAKMEADKYKATGNFSEHFKITAKG